MTNQGDQLGALGEAILVHVSKDVVSHRLVVHLIAPGALSVIAHIEDVNGKVFLYFPPLCQKAKTISAAE
jgi:hypothetical protein